MNYYLDQIKEKFYADKWYGPYDLIEFLVKVDSSRSSEALVNKVNQILEEEAAPYRVIERKVVPITSDSEMKEVKNAMNIDDKYSPIKRDLRKALSCLSERKDPDYRNSIKQAISVVEGLARIELNKPDATLGQIVDELDAHPRLRKSIKNLWKWASDESGVRHSEKKSSSVVEEEEARFALIICSAIVNYIIAK